MGSLKRSISNVNSHTETKKKRRRNEEQGSVKTKNFQKEIAPKKKVTTGIKDSTKKLGSKGKSSLKKSIGNGAILSKSNLKGDKKLKRVQLNDKSPSKRFAVKKQKGVKQDVHSNTTAEKPDWKELRIKSKEVRKKRKEQKCSHYDSSVKAKQMWEKLRRDDCPSDEKAVLTAELYCLVKNDLQKMVFTHDMARIVQWLLKLGEASIRASITLELKPILGSMVQSKYASFCVLRMLKYGSSESRNMVMQSFRGSVVKYMGHAIASPVVEYAYNQWANVNQRSELKQEFYGEVYKLAQGDKIQSIADAVSKSPDMKLCILADTKKYLLHIIDKGLFKSSLVLTVVQDYLGHCTAEDRTELLSQIQPYILDLLHIREGARIGMTCCWYSSNKDRKKLMKSLKGQIKNIAVSEHGHLFLLALFDSVDDTVVLKKVVISELIPELAEIAASEHGRKVILYLVAHRDPVYFHPSLMSLLTAGDASETIKKSRDIREIELRQSVLQPLLGSITSDTSTWFSSGSVAMVSLAILKSGKGTAQETAFKAIAKYICDSKSKVKEDEAEYPVVEHSGTHMVLKKLIQHDKEIAQTGEASFSSALVQELSEDTLKRWITCNRSCFLLTNVMESEVPSAKKMLEEKMNGTIMKQLNKQTSVGAKILLKKLKSGT